ncbi:unnamed protein product, partial [Leptidea sinapis]
CKFGKTIAYQSVVAVFGDSLEESHTNRFSEGFMRMLLNTTKGFLLGVTYRGIVVVVSPNVQQYTGYNEVDMLGRHIFQFVHSDDCEHLKSQLMPPLEFLGQYGELLVPDDAEGVRKISEALNQTKRQFVIRKSDKANLRNSGFHPCIRRARFKGERTMSSGNDVLFIGIARPSVDTFLSEKVIESFKMEYRTRHSIDGMIIEVDQRISYVIGYMTDEVRGVNAMNFMHYKDMRWVVVALREMYDQSRIIGESCYRIITKNGQLVYMRTLGKLDVDASTKAVTSFVCLNTMVTEEEGIALTTSMKKKYKMLIFNTDDITEDDME